MQEFWQLLSDSEQIIKVGGLALITLIVFAETGLFFCFFLPGDYLLFAAGLFCSRGILDVHIAVLITCIVVAAILGNFVGYYFGKAVGRSLYNRRESFFFKRKNLENTEEYFHKYGGRTLIMARFLPVVRTFAPIVAGIIKMEFGKFTWYVSVGALMWGVGVTMLGYILGELFPEIIHYLHYIIIAFVVVTGVIAFRTFFTAKKEKKA
jgi:membrane-associated protein